MTLEPIFTMRYMAFNFMVCIASGWCSFACAQYADPNKQESWKTPIVYDRANGHQKGADIEIKLPPGVRASVAMNCGDNRTIRILSQAGNKGRPHAEVPLIDAALGKGKALVLIGAQCQTDGTITVQSVHIEPEIFETADICGLPYAREKLSKCK